MQHTPADLIDLLRTIEDAQRAYAIAAAESGFGHRVAEDDIHFLNHIERRVDDGELTVETLPEAFGKALMSRCLPNLMGGSADFIWQAFEDDMSDALDAAGLLRPSCRDCYEHRPVNDEGLCAECAGEQA